MMKLFFSALVAGAASCGTILAADANPGSYLAARQAAKDNDFAAGARYYTESLLSDPDNPMLLESAVTSFVALGQIERAAPIAQAMVEQGIASQTAHMVLMANRAANAEWENLLTGLEAGQEVSPLVDALAQAWALVGTGDMTEAIDAFDTVISQEGMGAYGRYHKALALATVGDFEGAEDIFVNHLQPPLNARSAIAHAQVLSQLDRNDDALTMLDAVFGESYNPSLSRLKDALRAGETVPFSVVTDAATGLGEVTFMIAGLVQGEAQDTFTLQYARTAQHLSPENTEAIMLSGSLLQSMRQYELANETFALVPPTATDFPSAELGRIDALRQLDRPDAAIEVAEALARSHSGLPLVHAKLGDILRSEEQFERAYNAYTNALGIYGPAAADRWRVLFTRGIAAYAMDDWPKAEADFRAALQLNPEQPQVLNYLGYSLVERGEKLDEALGMIETAVAARPDNGAIVDSLGWVLFQLGRYDEAVIHMERAASLEAVDPIVNDHLGDVYWAVGRKVEAAFQWNRALSFDPEEELAARIRAKLERGLDAVLAEEGEAPLEMANDTP